MVLSDGLIYFGIIFLLLGIFLIIADRKQNKRTCGNKKLSERIIFYKNKWQGEHAGLIFAPVGVVVALVILSCITDLFVLLYLSGVVLIAAYVFIYNKMMSYVETNAFNGKGLEINN